MPLSKYLHFGAEHKLLEIRDYEGDLTALPDDLFDAYPQLEILRIYAKNLTALPASFARLNLQGFYLMRSKLKELPAGTGSMKSLTSIAVLDNNLMDFNKEAVKLAGLPAMAMLELGGYRGNTFPAQLQLLQALEELALPNARKNAQDYPGILNVLAALPRLKRVRLELPREMTAEVLTKESVQVLERFELIENYGIWSVPDNQLPLHLGLTERLNFDHRYDKILPPFREKVAGKGYDTFQLQLLFGLFIKNITALQAMLSNALAAAKAGKRPARLVLLDKPKGVTAKSVNAQLAQYGITVDNTASGENDIVVIGGNTTLEEVDPYLRAGCWLITTDQLNEVLIGEGEHWLLEDTHEPVNEQLLQLLCSNQVENYKIAFQIIATGGANKTIQSLLAAIMLAHPEKEIFKAAEKLYDKYGSAAFRLHVKESKISLRTSGDVDRKVNKVVEHPDIDGMLFRLMYHCIAGANNNIARVDAAEFRLKEMEGARLPKELVYFPGIKAFYFEKCTAFDIAGAIEILQQLPDCRVLTLADCRLTIPATIGSLKQLEELDVSGNTLETVDALGQLTALRVLNVEGLKIGEWDWLGHLKQLTTLNINNNGLTALPAAVFGLAHLHKLEAKQNKLTKAPEALSALPALQHLDLSNNAIAEFPYFLAACPLQVLLLRSNKISEVDSERLYMACKQPVLPWEELNLARNQLTSLQFRGNGHRLKVLDISHNRLTVLDDTLFVPSLSGFYASNNKIREIPRAVLKAGYYTYLWLQHNELTELPDYFAQARVQNCDLSNNKIRSIHPDFEKYGKENHGRLFWKLANNPLPKGQVGGIYI